MIDWEHTHAAIWRKRKNDLKAIVDIDPIALDNLVGVEKQKSQLVKNTEAFLQGAPSNNALLWGARGMGKSSLIKAVFNHFKDQGLRIIEFSKEDLTSLPEIIDDIRELPYKFIIFCDDLSFESGDSSYTGLKPILEGSIELPPKNTLIYASSNRRHLISELYKDNEDVRVTQEEIHYGDTIEEKISLSDRFGLWISFYQGSLEQYIEIVDSYFSDFQGDRDLLHKEAKIFATHRASRSGRTAKQFYNYFSRLI